MSRRHKKIGLLDHLGHGNLGDDATLDAVMQNIKARWSDAVMIGLSLNPDDTAARHGIRSYAIRRDSKTPPSAGAPSHSKTSSTKARLKRILAKHHLLWLVIRGLNIVAVRMPAAIFHELLFLRESLRIVISLDILIICGGGQLLDCWGGPWQFPWTLFKWVLLAKISRVECYFINVGAGPLDHPLSRWLVKRSLLLANYVSFRDAKSQRLVQTMGFSRSNVVFPDNVYSLDTPATTSRSVVQADKALIGISPMAYCDPQRYWKKDQSAYDEFIGKLALFGSWLLQSDHRLALFSTDIWFDAGAIDALEATLSTLGKPKDSQWLTRPMIAETTGLLDAMSTMDCIVTCRFHGVVFAHLMNIPVIALSHHPKVATLMNDLRLSEYCLDIRTFDPESLVTAYGRLQENRDNIRDRMASTLDWRKQELRMQFDGLFPQDASATRLCLKARHARA